MNSIGDFREAAVYSNQIYDLMAYVTEVISGESFEDLMIERIFKPANMPSTTFIHKMDLADDNLAKPYFLEVVGGPLRRVNNSLNA